MAIKIEPFAAMHVPEVRLFNARLREAGAPPEYSFFETPRPAWLPQGADPYTFNELFLALDGSTVRGGYALKHQRFRMPVGEKTLGCLNHPLTEGTINRAWSMVGALMLQDGLRRQPLLYCLGMGGFDRPLPRMLRAIKWTSFAIPFRFRILRPFRFLRGMSTLRRTRLKAAALDAAAFSGAGPLAIHLLQTWKGRAALSARQSIDACTEPSFGPWADEVWNQCAAEYPLIAVRDRRSLNVLFPEKNPRFTRLRIRRGDGSTLGWTVVSTRQMDNHPQYGRLRVGQILDVLAKPADALSVIRCAVRELDRQGADLAVCNHSHAEWVAAMDRAGFLSGPSNFIFASSPALAALLAPCGPLESRLFFTRADGDGLYQFL